MEKLKVLWLNWRCWLNTAMGGAEIFTHEVAKRWAKAEIDVTLFTSKFLNCKPDEILEGIKIVRRGGKYSVYNEARKYYEKNSSKEGFDVVVDEVNTRPFSTPKFVKVGTKIVALIHQLAREYWFYETPFPISYLGFHLLEKRWLKPYKKIPTVTVSESSRKDLIDLGFEQVFVVGEGLNFKPVEKLCAKKNPIIIYSGRLKKAKRPGDAIGAFKIIKEKVPEAQLWVIGDGYLKEKLTSTSCDGVSFFGSVSNEERRKLIQGASCLVNTSIREGFGLNVVEANALGVPCVAYDVAGLRDSVKHGETGLLVKSGDVHALADAILRILGCNTLRAQLSQKALEYSSTFSWDRVADEFAKIIRKANSV